MLTICLIVGSLLALLIIHLQRNAAKHERLKLARAACRKQSSEERRSERPRRLSDDRREEFRFTESANRRESDERRADLRRWV